jgi:outer membrane protein TolC
MKRIVILLLILIPAGFCSGQLPDTVTLDYCHRQAEKNYPLAQQAGLYEKSNGLRMANLNRNWLPQMNINGNASLQSEVTKISFATPSSFPSIGTPELSKDWYKLTFDVNQPVYDGNLTSYQKRLETATLQTDEKNVKIELYKLKERINQVYLGIFLYNENENLLNNTKTQLEAKLKEIRSAVQNGVMLASNADALQAEIYRVEQQITETRIDRTTAFKMLSELISVPVPESAHLELPKTQTIPGAFENSRLEYQLFDLQQDRLGLMKNMVTTKWNPRVYAFGQLGYGRPGFNMLSNDFTPWWIFGARLTWNPWNWNQNRNEKKIYDIQTDIVRSQKETFDKNTRIEAERGLSEIQKLTELLQKDSDIIALREKITRTASSQMENGVITSSEYISRLNEETQSRLMLELHRIQLVKANLSYLFILGKL